MNASVSNLGPGVVLLAWSLSAGGCVFFHLGGGSGEGGAGGATTTTSTGGAGGQGGASGSPVKLDELAGRGYAVAWNGAVGAALVGQGKAEFVVSYDGVDRVQSDAAPLSGAIAFHEGSPLVAVSEGESALNRFVGGQLMSWSTLSTANGVSGIAVFDREGVLVVQRSPAVLRFLDTAGDEVISTSDDPIDDQFGGHVTVGTCGNELPPVAWTTASADVATLRITTVGTTVTPGMVLVQRKRFGRPAFELGECKVVVASEEQDVPRYLRVSLDGQAQPLEFDVPVDPSSAHVAALVDKLFVTVPSTMAGRVDVLSCPSGASDPATCERAGLACASVGGLAAASGSVLFTCGDELYRWQ